MPRPSLRRVPVLVAAVAAAGLSLTACGSGSGGATPSQAQILSKLKSDSAVSAQLGQASALGGKFKNEALSCIAKVMHNDVPAADVRAYVNGDKSIQQLGQSKSNSKLSADLQTCLTNTVQTTPAP